MDVTHFLNSLIDGLISNYNIYFMSNDQIQTLLVLKPLTLWWRINSRLKYDNKH